MTTVYGPAPFPPLEPQADGEIDLAVRLFAERFTGMYVQDTVREALSDQLRAALQGRDLVLAAAITRDFLDTWPAAALVDKARKRWMSAPGGRALAVLHRVAALVVRTTGWSWSEPGGWPIPDDDWVRSHAGDGPHQVVRRHLADGAEQVAAALGVGCDPAFPSPEAVRGSELADKREVLARHLARGDMEAVDVIGPIPDDPDTLLALGEIRLEGRRQAAVERYGPAGLWADRLRDWSEVLEPVPAGVRGPRLVTTCTWAALPGTPTQLVRGTLRPVAYLLWEGPHAPIAVDSSAMTVLAAFTGGSSMDEAAATLEAPRETLQAIVDELIEVGALDAVLKP